MQGRHALITGGGSGIGRATAHLLAGLGAHVTVVGRRPEPLAETAEFAPDLISTATADLREPEQVDEMLAGVDACDFLRLKDGIVYGYQRRPHSAAPVLVAVVQPIRWSSHFLKQVES